MRADIASSASETKLEKGRLKGVVHNIGSKDAEWFETEGLRGMDVKGNYPPPISSGRR